MVKNQWDFKGWKTLCSEETFWTQRDWNITLLTIINKTIKECNVSEEDLPKLKIQVSSNLNIVFRYSELWDMIKSPITEFESKENVILIGDAGWIEVLNYETTTNDLEKFFNLYKSVGIELQIDVRPDKDNPEIFLEMNQETSPLLSGYGDFGSEIVFDKYGKFVKQRFLD